MIVFVLGADFALMSKFSLAVSESSLNCVST